MNVLLCTLGASWAVVPEVFAFLAPDLLDLYRWHPQSRSLRDLRQRHAFQPPDELWICTTGGAQTERSLALLEAWWIALGAPLPLRVWTAANTDQLASQAECDRIRELTFRLVLLASERSREGGQLVLCLAGGRKTMSADLQSAGALFGACAWLHVVGPDPLPAELRDPTPDLMARPLPQALAGAVIPLVVGRGTRSELIDIDDHGRIDSTHFSVPLARPRCDWVLPDEGASLTAELERRQRQGSQLMGNFLVHLAEREPLENWRSLYRLPPRIIDGLRRAPLCSGDAGWLAVLPKADLHRHLGGSLSIAAQRSVGRAIWDAESVRRRAAALDTVAGLLRSRADWPWSWPADLKSRGTEARALGCAALLVEASDEQLERNLYGVTEPRLALKFQSAHGFDAYERPGELSGSALLGHVAALSPYAAALVTQARQEGLVYAELRGSPHKYRPRDPASFVAELCSELRSYGGTCADGCHFGFVWILDRRQRESLDMVIGQAVAARQTHPDFLYGLDLAGDEGSSAPEALAACFTPAFRECLALTIHAGEGESAQHIWQAAYHLHADRIGHGLSLHQSPKLWRRFRDRGICLELCPTSNREVVGYRDPEVSGSSRLPDYPLRAFIDAGLPITICTDNPGISRTTLAAEYLAASRMTTGGLTRWEALALVRQSFVRSFLPASQREALLKRADRAVYELLARGD